MSPTAQAVESVPADRLFTEPRDFTDLDAWHTVAADLRRNGEMHH